MNKKLTKISVIIASRLNNECEAAIEALKKVDYPAKLIEVLIAYGTFPSRQRNRAFKKATGEIIYFLDDDSLIDKNAFKIAVDILSGRFKNYKNTKTRGFSLVPNFVSKYIVKKLFSGLIYQGKIGAVGGPAIWWGKKELYSQLSYGVTESFFAHFLMAARYRPIGNLHRANEKQLILCNLAVKSDVFRSLKGFNELLYPNEENELLNRIEKGGFQLVYHPGMTVYRRHREHPFHILKAFFNYGRGRIEQVRIEGFFMNIIFFTPLFLFIYLFILIFFHPIWFFLPLVFYFLVATSSAIGFSTRNKSLKSVILLPFLFFLAHLSYSLGNVKGMITDFDEKKSSVKIKIKKVKSFGGSWV